MSSVAEWWKSFVRYSLYIRNSGVLDRISRSSGGLQFGSSDKITLDLLASSTDDARLLSDALRIAGRLARLQFAGSADVALAGSVLGSMQVAVDGPMVHATAAVPDEQLERAVSAPK